MERTDGDDIPEEDRKFVVLESAAINTFLGDLARILNRREGSGDLVPPPATARRAKYDSLVLFVMTELDSQSLWIHRKHSDLSGVFGEAPTAVREARRQFDGALDVLVGEIASRQPSGNDGGGCEGYLLPDGFSAADILFANCCFWAQQIGWLAKDTSGSTDEDTAHGNGSGAGISSESIDDDEKEVTMPKRLAPELGAYLQQCRSRPAFARANEMRKGQSHEQRPAASKL